MHDPPHLLRNSASKVLPQLQTCKIQDAASHRKADPSCTSGLSALLFDETNLDQWARGPKMSPAQKWRGLDYQKPGRSLRKDSDSSISKGRYCSSVLWKQHSNMTPIAISKYTLSNNGTGTIIYPQLRSACNPEENTVWDSRKIRGFRYEISIGEHNPMLKELYSLFAQGVNWLETVVSMYITCDHILNLPHPHSELHIKRLILNL